MTDLFGGTVQSPEAEFIRRGLVPEIPDTGWYFKGFPEHYRQAIRLAYDVESRETDFEHGAGWARGCGYVVGISVAAQFSDGHIEATYFPIDHDMQKELNLEKGTVVRFLNEILGTEVPKFGANLQYDLGWLRETGIYPKGLHFDVQYAEALMFPNELKALDVLGRKYVGEAKETDLLYKWQAQAFPKTPPTKLRKHIWQSPITLVGHYAEQDAILPLKIIEKQWPMLAQQELLDVYCMECGLIPLLTEMREKGISIDLPKTLEFREWLISDISQSQAELNSIAGKEINADSSNEIAAFCDTIGVKYPRTEAGNASIKNDWLKKQTGHHFELIKDLREKAKILSTFIEGYFLGSSVNSKIHATFHPLKGEGGGTITGRFSSSDPNLQNVPARSELGKRIRELVVPDIGHETMWVGDYSQIEYLNLAHFAVGAGAEEVRQQYRDDPSTDYHTFTQQLVYKMTGMDIKRAFIKNINFGLLYGMSLPTLAGNLGISLAEAKPIFVAYHNGAPYVQETMNAVAREAEMNGFTRTIMGRKAYFDLWEPMDFTKDATALPYDQALNRYGPMIVRAGLFKAINYKLQGSAADCMKKAMWDGWRSGVFDVVGVPRLTVHDELVFSVAEKTKAVDEAFKEFVNIAQTCLPYSVPIRFEAGYGSTWGEAK